MRDKSDSGYILASTIGMLVAISIVAAALVGASGDAIARIRRAEADATRGATLQAALIVIGSQLTLDPRRRAIDLEDAFPTINVLGRPVRFRLEWESSKLDVNLATLEAIASALEDSGASSSTRDKTLFTIRAARASARPIRLLADLGIGRAEEDCLSSLLTVFGGRQEHHPEIGEDDVPLGRPAAGSRLVIDLAIVGQEADGLSVVVLVTGDPASPMKVMDWRRSSQLVGEVCDDAST